MANSKRLEVLITGNAKGAQKAFGDLEKSASKSGKKAESTLSKLNSSLIGFGVGAAVYGAFSAFDDAQKVMAQTDAVIKSTGASANVTAGEVEGLAGALSKKTGIDDEAIQSGENLLLTFTNIRNEVGEGNDVFDQATVAALDMSVALGTDMTSASQTLGKALNDPVAGMSKLTKIGVTFTQQQKDQVKALAESGDRLGAQKIILAELNKEFGGSAEAQATALGKAKVSFDNMAESIGGALAPALETATGLVGGLADAFSGLPSTLQTTTLLAGGGAFAWLRWSDGIKSAAGAAKGGIGSLKAASAAIGDLASSRGVSKGRATLEVLKSSLAGIGPTAIAAGGAAAGLGLGLALLAKRSSEAAERAEAVRVAVADLRGEAEQTGKSLEEVFVNNQLVSSFAENQELFEKFGISITDLRDHLTDSADDQKEWVNSLDLGKEGTFDLLVELDKLSKTYSTATAETKASSAANKELGITTEDTAIATQTAAERTAGYKDRLADLSNQAKEATDRINAFYDATTQTVASQIDVEAALDDVTQSLKDNGTTLDITSEKGRANTTAIIDAKDAQVEYAMQLRDTEGSNAAIAAMVDYSGKLQQTLIQSGLTEDQTKVLIAQMGLTPTDIYTKFGSNATAAEAQTQRLLDRFGQVPGWKNTYFNADTWDAMNKIAQLKAMLAGVAGQITATVNAAAAAGAGRNVDGNAMGGPVRAGGLSIVGEYGPELVKWAGNGTVIPTGASSRMMAGMGGGQAAPVYLTVQVQGSVVTERQLVDVVRTGLIDIGRRTGRPVLAGY